MISGAPTTKNSDFFGQRVLIVAAHPDDETLGAGGTISRLASAGLDVGVVFLADGETSRLNSSQTTQAKERIENREACARSALKILGCSTIDFLKFPDNQLDAVPLLDIVKRLELIVDEFEPQTILTHSASDLNVDHRTSLSASLTAARPGLSSVHGVMSFEIPSSTGLAFASARQFSPNLFVDVSDFLDQKMAALEEYGKEIPAVSHPRSQGAIMRSTRLRGDFIGVGAAEAFEVQWLAL